MPDWQNVCRVARTLPETVESTSYRNASWQVGAKTFVWQRPLNKSDLTRYDGTAPTGLIVAVRVADEGVKLALIADHSGAYFTISHLDGFPAVLIRMDRVAVDELEELVVEAWFTRAPARRARRYRDARA